MGVRIPPPGRSRAPERTGLRVPSDGVPSEIPSGCEPGGKARRRLPALHPAGQQALPAAATTASLSDAAPGSGLAPRHDGRRGPKPGWVGGKHNGGIESRTKSERERQLRRANGVQRRVPASPKWGTLRSTRPTTTVSYNGESEEGILGKAPVRDGLIQRRGAKSESPQGNSIIVVGWGADRPNTHEVAIPRCSTGQRAFRGMGKVRGRRLSQ